VVEGWREITMHRDCKKALARISKLCRENIAAMRGAKAKGDGVTDMAREILTEIRIIRREHRRAKHTGCRWTEDENGNWFTACGEAHVFIEGGPVENGHRYCPYCGREIATKGSQE
jgi:uncharacterized Zn-finger protein